MLDRLREHTAPLHLRAERAVDLPTRCGSLGAYGGLLARLSGLYSPLEARLARFDWAAAAIDFPARRKAPLLRADLLALGWTAGDVRTVPVCADLPELATFAAAFGALYVLEGATLGGQIVARQVHDALGIDEASGASFHACYRGRTGEMWRSFRGALEGFCADDEPRTGEALEAAAATFETFECWLSAGSP
jgi:heme oxygenase